MKWFGEFPCRAYQALGEICTLNTVRTIFTSNFPKLLTPNFSKPTTDQEQFDKMHICTVMSRFTSATVYPCGLKHSKTNFRLATFHIREVPPDVIFGLYELTLRL